MIKKQILKLTLFFFLFFLYFSSRIQNLLHIPVFADEAIYIRWSQIIASVETLRFIPLTDGKQPLFMWILAGFQKIITEPLLAGRLLSVIFGFFTMLTLAVTSALIADFKIKEKNPLKFIFDSLNRHLLTSAFAMLVYILLPFSFFFDRLSLPDNLLSFLGIFSLSISLLLAKFPRLDLSLILGMVLGISWLTKSPAIYFLVLSAFTFLVFNLSPKKNYIYPLISSILGFIIYNILRLGPQFHMIAIRNRDYIWSLSDILKHPLDPLMPHISDVFTILSQYVSLPVLIIGFLGLTLSLIYHNKQNRLVFLVVSLWFFLPLISNAAMAKVFTSRYILYTLPPLILLIVFGYQGFIYNTQKLFSSRLSQVVLIFVSFSLNIFWLYRISVNPFNSTLPSTESGYLQDWTSGWGIKNISEYLIKRSQFSNVIVGTEGYFGTLPDGLQIYTQNTNNLTVFGVGLDLTEVPLKLVDAKNHGDEVYMLFNRSRLKLTPEEQNKVELINSFQKPASDYLDLYRLK